MIKLFQLLVLCVCLFSGEASAYEVMTWVSSSFVKESKIVLESSYGGVPVKGAISRVGLQFWNIGSKGTVSLSNSSDADVWWFSDWGKKNNIEILLTVVNYGATEHNYNGFDWTLVRSACYGKRGDSLIVNLLAEVDKYKLAGIDLDFEGEDSQGGPFTNDDNIKYAVFVNHLCDSLHSRGKICTIDSYPGNEWGAPKPNWWSSWKGKIDAIHTMGYTSSYWSCPTEYSYQGQQNLAIKAGIEPPRLLMGMPMWVDSWAGSDNNTGTSNIENLNFIQNCLKYQTGIALWDIHTPVDVIKGTSIHPWISGSVWKLIKAIHDGKTIDPSQCPANSANGKVIDDMSNIGMNLKGGIWSAFSDNYSRTTADQVNSTKVLTSDRKFDMALQYGTYGDIAPGYIIKTGSGQEIQSIIKTFSKVGADAADAGFVMSFLPVDRSLDPTAQAWEIAKVGVERDLSMYKKLVIGVQGAAGKKIRIYLRTKAQLAVYAAGYGGYFTCSGKYEDFELPFASLKPIWGNSPTGFDAARSLQLTIEYVDLAPPSELNLNIAGVAVDTSVVSIKHLTSAPVEHNITDGLFYQLRSDGIYFNSVAETIVSMYSMEGQLLLDSSFYDDHLSWKLPVSSGFYIVRIQRLRQVFSEKIYITN
jgi:hypothetical protein